MATGAPAQTAKAQPEAAPKPDTGRVDKGPGSLAGNLTRDPELRYTPSGKAVVSMRVAVSERKFNERSQKWEDTPADYFDVTVWEPMAEHVAESLSKGQRIVAEGRWESQTWTDKESTIQERIVFVATDLGPSLKFADARVIKAGRRRA